MKKLAFLLLVLLATNVLGQDKILNYQGVLLDSEGQPVADGTYDAIFELYDAQVDGNRLWFDSDLDITTVNGAFSVQLGSNDPISSAIDFTQTLWLEIEVETSSFDERVRIDPEPTALSVESSLITMVSNRGSAVPIGTVVAFAGAIESIPDGWLVCDGSSFSSDDFPELANVLKNYWSNTGDALPDLRGMFLRGVSGDSGVDPDVEIRTSKTNGEKNMVGTTQEDGTAINGVTVNRSEIGTKATSSNGEHRHKNGIQQLNADGDATNPYGRTTNGATDSDRISGGISTSGTKSMGYTETIANHSHNINVDHEHNLSTSDGETRPVNVYVYYIIKAK